MTKSLIKENMYDASVPKVWEAITNPDKMRKWYFDMNNFKAEPGTEFSFTGGDENISYLHLCKVLEVIPEQKLSHTWTYENKPGLSVLTFELFHEGENKTRVVLTHEGLETFPQDDKNFRRESFDAGWTEIMGKLLPEYLKNN